MLVIAVLVLLSVVAMAMASPLFPTINIAIDSWADAAQGAERLR